ncbi:MAG: prepilin-type N-terminal cleavage/methylation domain-containing protein [candidate division Zixibacteria bacterium]|nr:prepilin-type N-terminal cleavage/methylation domain-containing protein [candidate division Zixibacteria bacterium]
MKRRKTNEEGFTLLEVMTSMLIMSFSLLMLLNMAMIALDGNRWSSRTTSCAQIMQQKLEDLRNVVDPTSGEDTVGEFSRSWTVSTVSTHLRQVEITAMWMSPDSLVQSNRITTLIKTSAM